MDISIEAADDETEIVQTVTDVKTATAGDMLELYTTDEPPIWLGVKLTDDDMVTLHNTLAWKLYHKGLGPHPNTGVQSPDPDEVLTENSTAEEL